MSENNNKAEERVSNYEKAEMDLLREALKRSYKERFQIIEVSSNQISISLVYSWNVVWGIIST